MALVCDALLCNCHFPIGILGQVWCLIVSIPDLYPPLSYAYYDYFQYMEIKTKLQS